MEYTIERLRYLGKIIPAILLSYYHENLYNTHGKTGHAKRVIEQINNRRLAIRNHQILFDQESASSKIQELERKKILSRNYGKYERCWRNFQKI